MQQALEILSILARFSAPEERQRAARDLAVRLGVEDVMIFVADPDIGSLIPAPGFMATLPGALRWQEVLVRVVENGSHQGMVPFPSEDRLVVCQARALDAKAAVVFIGGDPDPAGGECVLRALPLLSSAFQAEQTVVNARATTALARNAAKQLREQAASLEEARRLAHDGLVERRNAEAALEIKAAELERSNTDLQQFAAVVSHDLQEPLRMVTSYLTLIDDRFGGTLATTVREHLGHALSGAQRMAGLIRSLLEYAKVGAANAGFARVPMEMVVREALANLSQRIAETTGVIRYDELPSVRGNHVLLVQLVQNLLANALKFTKPGTAPAISISVEQDGDGWRFAIADQGIGIAPQHLTRIFGVFQRLHSSREYDGVGIGLATCRRIVETHGGRIGVVSSPGQGSTFWFTLPAVSGEASTYPIADRNARLLSAST